MRRFNRKKWRHDPRSAKFSHHKFFGTVSPLNLPSTLGKQLGRPLDQDGTIRCGAYGSVHNGWYIHKKDFSPDWQAYTIGRIQGHSIDTDGSDPNAVMKAMRDYGFLPVEVSPYSLERNGIDGSGFNAQWPSYLDTQAKQYDTIPGFVRVDGTSDIFDNIRSALQLAYDSKTRLGACVDAFSAWYDNWTNAVTIPQGRDLVGWHRYIFVDWVTVGGVPYLIAQNSYGTSAGQDGFHYFPREVVNREFAQPNRTLKICKTLTQEQIALAKQETPFGRLQRAISDVWYELSTLFV